MALKYRLATSRNLDKKREASFEFSILGHTIHYTLSDSTFIRVFGYEESTGIIFEVREIVVLRFRRQLTITSQIYSISS